MRGAVTSSRSHRPICARALARVSVKGAVKPSRVRAIVPGNPVADLDEAAIAQIRADPEVIGGRVVDALWQSCDNARAYGAGVCARRISRDTDLPVLMRRVGLDQQADRVGNLGDEPRRSIEAAGGKLHALPGQRARAKLRRGRHHRQQPDETEGDTPGKPTPVWSAER